MFASSGIFVRVEYKGVYNSVSDVCVDCGHLKESHSAGRCLFNGYDMTRPSAANRLPINEFANFYFKHFRYKSVNIKELLVV